MKKKYIFIGIGVVLLALIFAGGGDDLEKNTAIEEPVVQDESIQERIDFLKKFYKERFVDEDAMYEYEDQHVASMSDEMLDMLREQYCYECEDGNCYAWWVFRDASQDGPEHPKFRISHAEGDWFSVHYMGGETADLEVRVEGGAQDIMITGLKNPCQNIDVE